MCGDTIPPDGCIILTDFLNITSINQLSKQEIINYCKDVAYNTRENNKDNLIGGVVRYNAIEMEPFSENLFLDVIDIYNAQISGFEQGNVDFIFIKDIKSLGHLRGSLLGAQNCNLPVIISVYSNDDGKLCNGTSFLSAFLVAQNLGAKAFLINGQEKDVVMKIYDEILPFAKIPVLIDTSLWNDNEFLGKNLLLSDIINNSLAQNTYNCWKENKNSVKICCSNKEIHQKEISSDYEFALSSAREPFLFNQMYEISSPYSSEEFFPDDFLEIEDLDFDIIQIHLTTKQYAYHIAVNAYMLEKPVCFLCDDEDVLKTALIYYKGIPLVNGDCKIPKHKILELCKKYGAVLTVENSD